MNDLHRHILLLLSLPIYGVLIPLEILASHFHGWKRYSWKETAVNIYLNLINAGLDLLLRGGALLVLGLVYRHRIDLSLAPIAYWALLFLAEDFAFWLEHLVDHRVRLFWAVHVTHHSSEEYNLTTGFRSSVFMPAYRYLYFIPLALLGFHPIDILFMYALTQTYGILVHTQSIKRMPVWFEAIFVSPAHHRVHHASNIPYLDRNMGMVLIIWDRLFGTFQQEIPGETPRYGLVTPPGNPHHPTGIIFHEWRALGQDLRRFRGFRKRIKILLSPPGWSPDGSTKTARVLRDEWHAGKR